MVNSTIYGVDFTSAPRKAKPIVVASGVTAGRAFCVERLEEFTDFAGFERMLTRPGPWVGGFDFPFGLPHELLHDLDWPKNWPHLIRHCKDMTRLELRASFDAYRGTRPPGRKYAHRATDVPAGCSSAMKLVNPPVALMFHEGAPRLLDAGLHVPGLAAGDRKRVALEAYPGLLARSITRASYKNDTRAKQTKARDAARRAIVSALIAGTHPLGVKLAFDNAALRRVALQDATGDALDAILCAVQAAWAATKRNFGLPKTIPACEGWIVSARAQ